MLIQNHSYRDGLVQIVPRTDGNDATSHYDALLQFFLSGDFRQGDYLIMDNASIHHAQAVINRLLCDLFQVNLIFLPAYSPELNPAEYVFGHVKQYLRARRDDNLPFWVEVLFGFQEVNKEMVQAFVTHCIEQ